MDSRLVDTTEYELVDSKQPTNTYESESDDLQRLIEAYESEPIDLQQPTNMYEPEPSEELVDTSKLEPNMGGRIYPLRQRKAPFRYSNQYVLLTDEDEPECYEEAMVEEHEEKRQRVM